MKELKRILSLMLVFMMFITTGFTAFAEGDGNSSILTSNELEVDFGEAEKEEPTDIFAHKTYEFDIKHDYNQDLSIYLKDRQQPKEYTFKIVNENDDLYIGFGAGSEEIKMALGDYYNNKLSINANAQNAKKDSYEFAIQAYDEGKLVETAILKINITDMKFDIDVDHHIDNRGNVVLDIKNNSNNISDLTLKLPEEYSSQFALQRTVNNYFLRENRTVSVTIVPNFDELLKIQEKKIIFKVILTGNGKEKEVEIEYDFSKANIDKKTIKEYMKSEGEDLETETPKKSFGRFDFQNGELKLSEINDWPEEISITADEIKIIDDNSALQSTTINVFGEEDNLLGTNDITLKGDGGVASTFTAESYQMLHLDINDKEDYVYTKEIRIIKPSENIELSENVIELEDAVEEEIIKDFNSGSVQIKDDSISLDVDINSELSAKIQNGEVKQGDIIFLPDYDDGQNVMLASYLKVLSIDDENGSYKVNFAKASMDEIYADDTVIELSAESPSDLVEKYTYDIVNGFRVEQPRFKTMASRSRDIEKSFEPLKIDPIEIEFSKDTKLTITPKSFLDVGFSTEGLQKGKNGFINYVFKKKSYFYLIFNNCELNTGISLTAELESEGKKFIIKDGKNPEGDADAKKNLNERLEKLGKVDSKPLLKITGLDYSNRNILFAQGMSIEGILAGGVPKSWKNRNGSPLVLWFIVYIDADGELKANFEVGSQKFVEIDRITVAAKQKRVSNKVFGLDDDVEPLNEKGAFKTYLVMEPDEPKVESFDYLSLNSNVKLNVEAGTGLAISSFGEMLADIGAGLGLDMDGELNYCDVRADGIYELDSRLEAQKAVCENPGKLCTKANLKLYGFLKPRVKIDIESVIGDLPIEWHKDLKWTILDYHREDDECSNPDIEGPKIEEPKLDEKSEENRKKIFRKRKRDENIIKIPIDDVPGGTTKTYPSIIIDSQGKQCINARHREWNIYIPNFESIGKIIDYNNIINPDSTNSTEENLNENDYNNTFSTVTLFNSPKEENNEEAVNSKKTAAYLVSNIEIDPTQKNKYEEFKYFLNDKEIGESTLDIGGYQIFSIPDDSGLKSGPNILGQTNTHTNPGSYVVQTDTKFIIPLSENDIIYFYNGNPIVELTRPYVDMAVDTSSAKFKNIYPGLINSRHEFTAKVLNVGTKPCRAGVSLYEIDENYDEKRLDLKFADFDAMSEKEMTFSFMRKANCRYKLEVIGLDSNNNPIYENYPIGDNNSSRLKIDEISEEEIKPDVSITSYEPLTINATGKAGAHIKNIKLLKAGQLVAEREIIEENRNKSYSFEQSYKDVDMVEVTDEYGTKAELAVEHTRDEGIEYIVKLAEKPKNKQVQIYSGYSRSGEELSEDNTIPFRLYKNDPRAFMLNYDNVFYYVEFNENDKTIDLNGKKLIEQKFNLGEGVKIKSFGVRKLDSEGYYYISKKDDITDTIMISPGKYRFDFELEKDGVVFNKYFNDVEIREDQVPEALTIDEDVKESILVKVESDLNINYSARVENMDIPKDGIKLRKRDYSSWVTIKISGEKYSNLELNKKIDMTKDNIIKLTPLKFNLLKVSEKIRNTARDRDYIYIDGELKDNQFDNYSAHGNIIRVRNAETGKVTYAYGNVYKEDGKSEIRVKKIDIYGNPITGKNFVSLVFDKVGKPIVDPDDHEDEDKPGHDYNPGDDYNPGYDYTKPEDREDNRDTVYPRPANKNKKAKEKPVENKKDYGLIINDPTLPVNLTDIPETEVGQAVKNMIQRGILVGMNDKEFGGEIGISRAMVATVLMRISKDKTMASISFSDVKSTDWFYDAVRWGVAHEIFKGYPDGTFKANSNVSRQEFAVIMDRFLEKHGIDMSKIKEFNYTDADKIHAWSLKEVKSMDETGLILGKNQEIYDPTGEYSRFELAQTLNKLVNWVLSNQ